MPRRNVHIALLRGINVGKAKRIAMADLRKLVEKLGYRDVKTILNSGNIVYAAGRGPPRQTAAAIEKALPDATGVSSKVTGLSAQDLDEIITSNPFPDAVLTPSRFLIAITGVEDVLKKLDPLTKQDWGTEALAVEGRAAYMWCPQGVLEGKVVDAASRVLGDGATIRNWATCNRIAAVAKALEG